MKGGIKMMHGQYKFTNDILINSELNDNEIDHVIQHENIHKLLSGGTAYGFLLIMMEKASLVDNRKNWISEELILLSNKMQEQTATFIEYLWILKKKGSDEFEKKISDLKENKPYYNYFNHIYRKINPKEINKENSEGLINTVMSIAIHSLNVNIDEIPFDKWSSNKDIKRFFSKKENLLKYHPNKRFKELIKLIFEKNGNTNADILTVLENNCPSDMKLELCKSAIKKIFSKSEWLEIINNRMLSFHQNPLIDVNDEDLAGLSAFPSFVEASIVPELEEKSLSYVIAKLRSNQDSALHFSHALGGLENMTILAYMPFDYSNYYITLYNKSDIINIIKAVENPIVFSQGKLYKWYKNKLFQKFPERNIYVFMENSFYSSFKLIIDEFKFASHMFYAEEKYDILIIKNNNHILIQIVVKGLRNVIKKQLKKGEIRSAVFNEIIKNNEQEIRKVAETLFMRCNWAINNKNHGFKQTNTKFKLND